MEAMEMKLILTVLLIEEDFELILSVGVESVVDAGHHLLVG